MTVWFRVVGGTATAMTQTWTVSDCFTLAAASTSPKKLQNRQIATPSIAAHSDIDISPRPIICPANENFKRLKYILFCDLNVEAPSQ